MSLEGWEELLDLLQTETVVSPQTEDVVFLSDTERIAEIKAFLLRIYQKYTQDLGIKFNHELGQQLAQQRAELIFKEDLSKLVQLDDNSSLLPYVMPQPTLSQDQEMKDLLQALSKLRSTYL